LTTVLIDTNVLGYRLDGRQPAKRARAHEVLVELQPLGIASLTTQVLGEFFRVVTKRLQPPISPADAHLLLRQLIQSFNTWPVDRSVVLEAARGVRDHQISYWDAQLWATALRHGATVVLSEDFSDGQTIEGVTFKDPFASGFNLKRLASTT